MSKPIIFIQSRKGGTRLPGKINQLIGDQRMIDHVRYRVRQTGITWSDCRAEDFPKVDEEDVLGRFKALTESVDPWSATDAPFYDPIIRVTADCPLIEPWLILHALALYKQEKPVALVGTGPEWDGWDVEVISRAALQRAFWEAPVGYDRTHVTPYIKRTEHTIELPLKGKAFRFSVDDQEGLDFVRAVMATCDLCAQGVNHHTNSAGSIGGSDRQPILDLHHLERGDLIECKAGDLLEARRQDRPYVSR